MTRIHICCVQYIIFTEHFVWALGSQRYFLIIKAGFTAVTAHAYPEAFLFIHFIRFFKITFSFPLKHKNMCKC